MKKNLLKSALAVAALESIDSEVQTQADDAVAAETAAGSNLPTGEASAVPATTKGEAAPAAAEAGGEPSATETVTGNATAAETLAPDAAAAATDAPAADAADAGADAVPAEADAGADADLGGVAGSEAGADLGADLGGADAGGEAPGEAGADAGAAEGGEGGEVDLGADGGAEAEVDQPDVNAPAGEEVDPAAAEAGAEADAGGEGDAAAEADQLTEEADAALAEEIDSSMGEVEAAAGENEDLESDIGTMNDALESLDNCSAILTQSIQRGGLDQTAAKLLRNNVNTVTRQLKIKNLTLPALESLEDPSSKIEGADVANNQVTGLMQRISETVRGGLTHFGKWISTNAAQLTDVYSRLEKRADLLGQRAQSAEADKGGEVDAKGLIAGGQPVQNLVKYLQGLEKSVVALGQAQTYDSYIQLLDTAEELVKNPTQAEELAATATKQLLTFRKKIASVSAQGQGENAGGAVHFLGNRSVQFSIPGDLNDLAGFSSKTVYGGDGGEGTVPALKQKEVVAVCAKVKELAGSFRQSLAESNGNIKQINKRISDKMSVIVDLSSRLDAKDGESGGSFRKAATWVSSIVTTSAKLPAHAVYSEVPRTLSLALDFASKSIGPARPAVAPEVAAAQ